MYNAYMEQIHRVIQQSRQRIAESQAVVKQTQKALTARWESFQHDLDEMEKFRKSLHHWRNASR